MSINSLDGDFYESIIAYNMLVNESYLSSVIDHLDKKYFNNKDIAAVVELIVDFYTQRNTTPTLTELKSRLTTNELKVNYKSVVQLFDGFDKKFNHDDLYENIIDNAARGI